MIILIIVHLCIVTQMFLQWVLYTDLKKNSGIQKVHECFWHDGKINFISWEGTGKQIHILREIIALGSKALGAEGEGEEEDTERPSKWALIWYEQWKCSIPTTEFIDTREPKIPQGMGRSAGGWSSKDCRSFPAGPVPCTSHGYKTWVCQDLTFVTFWQENGSQAMVSFFKGHCE